MAGLNKQIIDAARKAHERLKDVKEDWFGADPIKIEPYLGYASHERLFIKGRVLEDDNVLIGENPEALKKILYSLRRFETDEIPGVRVNIQVDHHQFQVITDEEGYFEMEGAASIDGLPKNETWIEAKVALADIEGGSGPITAQTSLLLPDTQAEFGVISDIDDTILETHVTSLFRLKMMFVTLFKEAGERMVMEGMLDLYDQLATTKNGHKNPFFYVSNSPWNIYPELVDFLEINELPKGPVLLRDIGLSTLDKGMHYRGHKIETITQILQTYPDLSFIFFGDTGSKDADIYLDIAKTFPNQIKTIYIRHLKHTKNARRIVALIEQEANQDIRLIHSSAEIIEDAQKKGYL